MSSISTQLPRTMSARQTILELGNPDGRLAPIYDGILKHLNSIWAITDFLQASRPANEHWKIGKNASAVLWPYFLEKIPHFQEVIVAARMTNYVATHEQSLKVDRPEIFHTHDTLGLNLKYHKPLNEVPGLVGIPSFENIRDAFCLHRLSVFLQRKIVDRDITLKKTCIMKAAGQGSGNGVLQVPAEGGDQADERRPERRLGVSRP